MQPLLTIPRFVPATRTGAYQDCAVAHFYGISRNIISEEIKGAAAGEVEAGVMPVAGENAILHSALVQRKAHVRTAVIHRMDSSLVMKHGDRTVGAFDDDTALGLYFFQRGDANEVRIRKGARLRHGGGAVLFGGMLMLVVYWNHLCLMMAALKGL